MTSGLAFPSICLPLGLSRYFAVTPCTTTEGPLSFYILLCSVFPCFYDAIRVREGQGIRRATVYLLGSDVPRQPSPIIPPGHTG